MTKLRKPIEIKAPPDIIPSREIGKTIPDDLDMSMLC